MIKRLILIFMVCSATFFSHSQNYTISGFVSDSASKELMISVNVYIPLLKTGTTSNNYGFYSITLPKGIYQVTWSFVGYKPVARKIKLDRNIEINIDMSQYLQLQEVVISGNQNRKISQTPRMSTIEIPVAQIKSIPALLGEKDVLKVIQLMPGVQKGREGTSGLYVRGGGIDQNLIILDDATVYNAFHLFGFFSLFNGDAIKSVELIKGGFPARYGGRLSSVIEMNMKDGNKRKYTGEGSIGLISSKFVVEGPFAVKDKSSFLISGRRTYLDLLLMPLMPVGARAGYYFYDFNAKINFEIDKKNRIYASGYFGRDKFFLRFKDYDMKENVGLFWENQTGTLRWNHLYNDKLFSNTSLIFSNYKFEIYDEYFDISDHEKLRYYSGIQDYSLKFDLEYHPYLNHIIRTGLLSTMHIFRPGALVVKGSLVPDFTSGISDIYSVENGLYAEDEFTWRDKTKINAGIRISNFIEKDKSYLYPEPRVSMSYLLTKNLAVKASYVIMNQYIHLLTNSGLGLPTDLWVPSTSAVPSERNQQVALGFAKDLEKKDITISLEGYYKSSLNVLEYREGASFLMIDDPSTASTVKWEDNVTNGKCWSYGAELLIQRKYGKISGWIGYTLSWTQLQFDEINFGRKYYATYDRRHDVSIVLVYEPTKEFTFSTTWVYGTGNAISLPLSEFNAPPYPVNNFFYNNYYNQNTDYGEKNGFRMAPYHRLDVGLQFHKPAKRFNAVRTWEISVYNLYNRKNPYYYYIDYNGRTNTNVLRQVSLFGLIPSISYSLKF